MTFEGITKLLVDKADTKARTGSEGLFSDPVIADCSLKQSEGGSLTLNVGSSLLQDLSASGVDSPELVLLSNVTQGQELTMFLDACLVELMEFGLQIAVNGEALATDANSFTIPVGDATTTTLTFSNLQKIATPEPSSISLSLLGLAALVARRRR